MMKCETRLWGYKSTIAGDITSADILTYKCLTVRIKCQRLNTPKREYPLTLINLDMNFLRGVLIIQQKGTCIRFRTCETLFVEGH